MHVGMLPSASTSQDLQGMKNKHDATLLRSNTSAVCTETRAQQHPVVPLLFTHKYHLTEI